MRAVAVAALVVATALISGASAQAALSPAVAPAVEPPATGLLQLSSDGRSFGPALERQLFADVGGMVPTDARAGRFWVRNNSTGVAYLRLMLASSGTGDRNYAAALSLQVAIDGVPARRVSFADASGCANLARATTVRAGQSVKVDAILRLDDLDGAAAQRADAGLDLRVSLSDVPPASGASHGCALPAVRIPVDPGSSPRVTPTAPPTAVASSPTPTSTTAAPAAAPFVISDGEFERWGALWPLGGLLLGGVGFAIGAWRRRRQEREEAAA